MPVVCWSLKIVFSETTEWTNCTAAYPHSKGRKGAFVHACMMRRNGLLPAHVKLSRGFVIFITCAREKPEKTRLLHF